MKTRKKVLTLVLALLVVCSFTVASSFASGGVIPEYNNIQIQFGDPSAPASWPENNMDLQQVGLSNTYNAVYNVSGAAYYPSVLSMYAKNNFAVIRGNGVSFLTYDENGEPDEHAMITRSTNINNGVMSDVYTLSIGSNGGSITFYPDRSTANPIITINFSAPNAPAATSGSVPSAVCGYLQIGQYARVNSFGWGTIFTDNTNVYASTKTPKFVGTNGGYVPTGVSLGMLGGYVQFEFDNPISNDPAKPYGIDFIVYGNAFNGNPEAGCVMVYGKNDATQKYGWYNLAGSRHYMSGTNWDVDITYIKIETANTVIGTKTFGAKGIYTSTNFVQPASDEQNLVNAAISAATWSNSPITTVPTWWPEEESGEDYAQVWKINGDSHVDGVYWNTSGTAPVITFEGLTQVQDDMEVVGTNASQAAMTDVYQWGYADVRENGSLSYGTAINPYASAASAVAGGDGFDLSWAVDSTGNPVSLSDVHFVRVYSGVLYNAGVFGETSTEVCGLYVTSGSSGSPADSDLSIWDAETEEIELTTSNMNVQYVNSGSYVMYSEEDFVFVNGVSVDASSGYTLMFTSGDTVQIITQSDTDSPYITVIKCN